MSRPIEQALNNLIPRHPGALPSELIELARSLLAQSRMKASTLKAEEEIGRTYACANIACERLKTKLDLPPIEPRPPIPPRTYTKLYNYFDRTLVVNQRRKSRNDNEGGNSNTNTPSSKRRGTTAASTPRSLSQRQTPSKAKSLDPYKNNRTPKSGLKYASNADLDSRVPQWLSLVVRKMCAVMETRQAIPHVIAGVESMLRLPKTLPTGKEESPLQPGNKTPALIAATWFFVLQEFSGKDITGSEFRERRTKIMKVFKDIKNDKVIAAKITGDVDEFWESWEDIEPMDVQAWIAAVTERDWLEMDWFTNIGKPEDQGPLEESNNHMDAQEFDTSSSLGKRRRIGRMMQDEYDYLSPENKAEYQHWKENILAQIDDLIAGGVMDTTDG